MRLQVTFLAAALMAGCTEADTATAPTDQAVGAHHAISQKKSDDPLPVADLARLRQATARYHNIQKAYDDEYVDINVVIPNMGRHLLKERLMNATFEVEKPELLVYAEGPGGQLKLVAVEFAIPLNLSANAPEGFPGAGDGWFANQQFGLWTLHAWVWKDNPDGVFHATNVNVP